VIITITIIVTIIIVADWCSCTNLWLSLPL